MVPGVGLYNAASSLTNAYSRSTPVLLVAGQIPRAAIGKNLGAVHEIADQPGAVRSVTKWHRQASRPREVPDAVVEAFRQMRTGRPRPVLIEMPPEAGVEQEEVQLRNPARISRIVPSPDDLREAARVIAQSHLPLIYAGGGVARSDAEEALVKLAEATKFPLLPPVAARGPFRTTIPCRTAPVSTLAGRDRNNEPALRCDAVRRRNHRNRRALFAGQSRGRSGHAREHQHRRQRAYKNPS